MLIRQKQFIHCAAMLVFIMAGLVFCADRAHANGETIKVKDPLAAFTQRIENAYRADNKKARLWDLFYTRTLDREGYYMLIETIEKLDLLEWPITVLAEPLHPDEELSEVSHGYIYFQNLDPVGAINIVPQRPSSVGVLRQYYAMKDGRIYLTATVRQPYEEQDSSAASRDNWFYRRNRGQ